MSAPIVEHVPHLRCEENYRIKSEQAQMVGETALETGNALPVTPGSVPGDKLAMRGIPLQVEQGLGGAIRGTRPTDAIGRIRE